MDVLLQILRGRLDFRREIPNAFVLLMDLCTQDNTNRLIETKNT